MWTGWIRWGCDGHKKQVDVKQLYNLVPQTVRVSWSQLVEVPVAVRSSENQLPAEGLGPQDPRLSSPAEWETKCCYSQRNWGSICCSLFSLQVTSHTQPFRNSFATLSNKVWEVYFSKEVCSFVFIVEYVSANICIHSYITATRHSDRKQNQRMPKYWDFLVPKRNSFPEAFIIST